MPQHVSPDSRDNLLSIVSGLGAFNANVIHKGQTDVWNMFLQNLRDYSDELSYRIRGSLRQCRLPKQSKRCHECCHIPALRVQLDLVIARKKINERGDRASRKLL